MYKTLTKVVERHPDTVRERLWRTGIEEHSLLYCGGEVPANIKLVMQLKIWVGFILAYGYL